MPELTPEKPVRPGDESKQQPGNAAGLVGVHADAINALNAALNGVQLLGEVVTHIQRAASALDAATQTGVATINKYVEDPVKPEIKKLAVEAVAKAIAANPILIGTDPFEDPVRMA